jgi:hypothetical protein
MANRNEDVVTKPSAETADHLEKAVRANDKTGYDNAMAEVNNYQNTHSPQENKAYTAAVTKKLEDDKVLPTVALFEAQSSFSKIDTSGNGRLERGELDNFANRRDVNDLQRNLIGNIQQNYEKIRDIDTWGETWYGGNSAAITKGDINDGVKEQQAQMNLYAPDKSGKSLIDKLVDKDGNIPHGTIAELRALEAKHPGQYLSPEDKKTLDDLDSKRSWYSRIPFTDDMSASRLNKAASDSATSAPALKDQPRDSRIETPTEATATSTPHQREMAAQYSREVGHSREHEQAQKDRDVEIAKALTVHSHQSYAHSAERLLALAGNHDPSAKELREVSHQLWVADGQKKKGELHANHTLTLDDSLKNNPALAKLFAPIE